MKGTMMFFSGESRKTTNMYLYKGHVQLREITELDLVNCVKENKYLFEEVIRQHLEDTQKKLIKDLAVEAERLTKISFG